MSSIIKWLKEEIIRAIPAIIYFVIILNIIHFIVGLMLNPGEPRYTSAIGATIDAIILGKVIIIANAFAIINAFPNKPLIYGIVWKSIIYSFFAFVIQLIDIFCSHLFTYKSMILAYQHVTTALVSSTFWGVQLLIVLLLTIYVIFSEFIRVIGKDKVEHLLFG